MVASVRKIFFPIPRICSDRYSDGEKYLPDASYHGRHLLLE